MLLWRRMEYEQNYQKITYLSPQNHYYFCHQQDLRNQKISQKEHISVHLEKMEKKLIQEHGVYIIVSNAIIIITVDSESAHFLSKLIKALLTQRTQEQALESVPIDQLIFSIEELTRQLGFILPNYEKHLQALEDNLRKHAKTEIELKLYYEHLEQTIHEMKVEQKNTLATLDGLKSENQMLRQREKQFVPSSNNTRNGDEPPSTCFESKLDTITKIKNRLSLNDTGYFYNRNPNQKIEKDPEVKQLHHKRESLASTLQKLYEGQTLKKSPDHDKKSVKKKLKPSKKSQSRSQKSLSKSKKNSLEKGQKKPIKNPSKETSKNNSANSSCLNSRRGSRQDKL